MADKKDAVTAAGYIVFSRFTVLVASQSGGCGSVDGSADLKMAKVLLQRT